MRISHLTPELRRLIIAAREVAYEDQHTGEMFRELDQALEPFSAAVPWRDEERSNVG